ncbi:hypothetical protein P2H44_14840 [Albimonas sp. CAU 1670]|uniref:hypothetical protein n=1 Tax=Albimonas sp. CAU 1670 TaxID=3032599 RepID=UPI0023DA186E|nr:hypothetical protein [Albimonas sp. CAU 1670]MDF2233835.1 hypothetical protein [Albimonas sp. CAU 1670]
MTRSLADLIPALARAVAPAVATSARRAGLALAALAMGAGLAALPVAPTADAASSRYDSSFPNITDEDDDYSPGAPPAGRFESGGGPIREVRMDPSDPGRYVGVWEGPFKLMNMRYFETEGGIVGRARLTIADVQGTLARGLMRIELEGEERPVERWTGAFTKSGHIMVLNAHAILFQQGRQRYIEADIQLNNGKFYRMRLSRIE